MEINGQEWQDEIAYAQFMSKKGSEDKVNFSNSFENDYRSTIKALSDRKDYVEALIYSHDNKTIYPGSSALISTGIPIALLEMYELKLQLLANIELTTWLRISPFLIPEDGIASIDVQNISQYYLAKDEYMSGGDPYYTIDAKGIYVATDLNNLGKERHHVAYSIEKGDKIAQMILRKK